MKTKINMIFFAITTIILMLPLTLAANNVIVQGGGVSLQNDLKAARICDVPGINCKTISDLLAATGSNVWEESGSNDDIYFNTGTGKVGIGTTNPSADLDIDGQIRIRGGTPIAGRVLTSTDNTGIATWEPVSAASSQWITRAGGDNIYYDPATEGNVAIGEMVDPTSTFIFEVNGATLLKAGGRIDGGLTITSGTPGLGKVLTSNAAGLVSWKSPNWTSNSGNIYFNTGNVSIGTSTSRKKLTVAGGASFGIVICAVNADCGTGGVCSGGFCTAGSVIDSSFRYGNVGIGTTSPAGKLHIFDSAAANAVKDILIGSTIAGFPDDVAKIQVQRVNSLGQGLNFVVNTDGAGTQTEAMRITSEGNVGIGTTTPAEKLEVNGNVKAVGFLYSSDETLKKNIQPIENPLEKVKSLNGVAFEWKETDKRDIGFVAQDVEKVLPELVTTSNTTGLKSVEYGNIVAVLVEAVKAQNKILEAQNIKMEELQNKIDNCLS
jgi:hypothetical protein